MKVVATLGPEQSHAWQVASQYAPDAEIRIYPHVSGVFEAFSNGEAELAIVPVYNTREGENKEYFRLLWKLKSCFWIDNIVKPTNLSLGVFDNATDLKQLQVLLGKRTVFRQCEEYLGNTFQDISLMSVHDLDKTIQEVREQHLVGRGVIDSEEMLKAHGLHILEREVAAHNRTRYAVLGKEQVGRTGYDATAFVTLPLDDRVGILVDMLNEFSQRGINILDMRSENDVKTQKLQIHMEVEGHIQDKNVREAVTQVENNVIQQAGSIKVLGSFPRIDMRTKYINSLGFIGTGSMSEWFADRLKSEGYQVVMTGRSTSLRPEEMIPQVDVVVICVPISVTSQTIMQYGPLVEEGKALILLAGESETTLNAALNSTSEGVEVMLVHNLWGPQAATMKDKNAIVVRSSRSGRLCSEFEAFLYKHGATIYHDSAGKHDLLMGIGQKLPTMISVALAMTLEDNRITSDDISGHCTLTSLYPILAMARVHSQNSRTYAEIMSTKGDSERIVLDFIRNLRKVIGLATDAGISDLCSLIDQNSKYLTEDFLRARMTQAKALDDILGRMI